VFKIIADKPSLGFDRNTCTFKLVVRPGCSSVQYHRDTQQCSLFADGINFATTTGGDDCEFSMCLIRIVNDTPGITSTTESDTIEPPTTESNTESNTTGTNSNRTVAGTADADDQDTAKWSSSFHELGSFESMEDTSCFPGYAYTETELFQQFDLQVRAAPCAFPKLHYLVKSVEPLPAAPPSLYCLLPPLSASFASKNVRRLSRQCIAKRDTLFG
jgi:hypothetical protein